MRPTSLLHYSSIAHQLKIQSRQILKIRNNSYFSLSSDKKSCRLCFYYSNKFEKKGKLFEQCRGSPLTSLWQTCQIHIVQCVVCSLNPSNALLPRVVTRPGCSVTSGDKYFLPLFFSITRVATIKSRL